MNLPDIKPDPGQVSPPEKGGKRWQDKLADEVHNFTRGMLAPFGGAERLSALGHSMGGPQFPREMAPEAYDQMNEMGYGESHDYFRDRASTFEQNLNLPEGVPIFGGANIPEIAGNVAGGTALMKGLQHGNLLNKGRWRDIAGLGTLEGAAAGYGYSSDEDAGRGALEGGITGFGLSGIAFPAGIRAASFLKGLIRPGQERLALIMTRAAKGADPEELMDDPNMLPADLMPAFGELSNFLARESPEAYKMFQGHFGERAAGRMGRVYQYAKDTFRRQVGDNDGIVGADGLEAIDAARQIQQKGMYGEVFKPPTHPDGLFISWKRARAPRKQGEIKTQEVVRGEEAGAGGSYPEPLQPGERGYVLPKNLTPATAVQNFMNSRAFRHSIPGMLKKYENPYGIEPYRDVPVRNQRGKLVRDEAGNLVKRREYSLAFVSEIYKDLGDDAKVFFEGVERKPAKGHRRQAGADKGLEAILELSPFWKHVQSYSGQTIRMRNAFKDAKEHISNDVTIADVQRYWKELGESQRTWETQKGQYEFKTEGKTDNAIDAYRSGWLEGIAEMVEENSGNPETLKKMLEHNFKTKVGLIAPQTTGGRYLADKIIMESRYSNTEKLATPSRVNLKKEDDSISIARVIVRNLMWYTGFSMSELGERSFRKMLGPGEDKLNAMVAKALITPDLSMIRGRKTYPNELGVLPVLAAEKDELPDSFQNALDDLEEERSGGGGGAPADATRTEFDDAYERLLRERGR